MISQVLALFGGVAIFIYGLTGISRATESVAESDGLRSVTSKIRSPILAFLLGILVAGVTQSSVAVSVITVSLVECGLTSFYLSAAIIMGANVGTTATAQLISLTGLEGCVIGSLSAIIGLLLSFSKNPRNKTVGDALMGLGFLFAGLSSMTTAISGLRGYRWFTRIFTIKSPVILFLNGVLLTAVMQSSSAVTGISVILAKLNAVTFTSSAFLTLGSNVGSCFAVVVTSLNKNTEARRAAFFNLFFNLLGAVLFFPVLYFFGDWITALFLSGVKDLSRAIANFHTVFNLLCSLIFLPVLKPLTKLLSVIISDGKPKLRLSKTFGNKSTNFY